MMFGELFDPERYFFNPHALPSFVAAVGLVFVLLQFLFQGVDARIRTPLTVTFAAASLWLLAFHGMYSSRTEDNALAWAKVGYLGVPFLAVATYDLAVRLRGVYDTYQPFVWAAWLVSAVFAALAFNNSELIDRVTPHAWGFYPLYGQTGTIFLIYFALMAGGSLWHLYRAYQTTRATAQNRMVMFIAWGVVAGYLAGIDFIPKLGAPVYPVGYVCIVVSALLVSQGVAEGAERRRVHAVRNSMSALRRLQLQERALLASVKAVLSDGMPAESLKQLVEAVADGLDVERVAVWQYDGAARMLQCRDLYRRTSGVHRMVGGQFVHPAAGYLDALEAGLRLSVDHAQADARMAAFFAVYLGPEGPIAALESPLRRDHRFLGVLSCHASGGTREWHADEHQFLDVMVGLIAPLVEAGAGGVWSTERVPRSSEAIQAAMDLLLTRQALGPSPDA